MTHTIFVDTPGIEYIEAQHDEYLTRYLEIGDRAIAFGQSLLPPSAHRYEVLMGQLTREASE